ncbi:MAG: EAL and HDOD domain-containing protein [Burkholderiaceae bacterium]
MIDQRRNAVAMRINLQPDASANTAALYRELAVLWADGGSPVVLRSSAAIDEELLSVPPLKHVWIEVPVAVTENGEGQALLGQLRRSGYTMVLGGRPRSPLPPDLVPAFQMSVIHVDDDRRLQAAAPPAAPAGVKRSIPFVQAGVRQIATMEQCFARGAYAVIGWPMDDAMEHASRSNSNPDYSTIIQLMSMIEDDADPSDMERLIRRDAALAYKLLRYINSPGFGLSVEVQSFRHAVMMLGYARLKRWLALLLATACKDANLRPVMVASFRRGVFLEHLIGTDQEAGLRDEVFILGVFSLLDKLMHQPFDVLFEKMHVPERVRETLVTGRGAYAPYLKVVESIESGPDASLRDRLDDCVMSLEQCNRAVLSALTAPDLVGA